MVVSTDENLIQDVAEQGVTANNIYKKLNLAHYSILKGLIVTTEMLLDFFIIKCITLDLDKWQSGSMASKCKCKQYVYFDPILSHFNFCLAAIFENGKKCNARYPCILLGGSTDLNK